MDLSTAIRSFLKKAIAEGGMPFDVKLDEATLKAMAAVRSMRETSEANGNSKMTLGDINGEIKQTRKDRKK